MLQQLASLAPPIPFKKSLLVTKTLKIFWVHNLFASAQIDYLLRFWKRLINLKLGFLTLGDYGFEVSCPKYRR
jgi:hypothetical protein